MAGHKVRHFDLNVEALQGIKDEISRQRQQAICDAAMIPSNLMAEIKNFHPGKIIAEEKIMSNQNTCPVYEAATVIFIPNQQPKLLGTPYNVIAADLETAKMKAYRELPQSVIDTTAEAHGTIEIYVRPFVR